MTTLTDYETPVETGTDDEDEVETMDPAIADEMIDRIEQVPQVGEYADGIEVEDATGLPDASGGRLPAYELPGFGGKMQDDCGHDQPHYCDECGEVHSRSRRCGQSRCGDCWESWVMERAETHVARADAVARTLGSSGEAHHKHHVAFMLPPDWRPQGSPAERYEATKNVVRDIISDIWGDDAMYCYHGWSGSGYGDEGGRGEGDHNDLGEWADRLPDEVGDREWEGDVRDELYQRPHFHAIIVSARIPGNEITSRVYDETGWFIRRFSDDQGRSITGLDEDGNYDREEEMKSLARATSYTLSHLSIDTGEPEDDNDAKVHTCGSAWRNYRDIKTMDDTELEAKRAVRSVAPKTLGLDEDSISCAGEVAPERVAGADADEYYSEDHGDDGDHDHDADTSMMGRVVGVDDTAGLITIQSGTEQREVRAENLDGWSIGDKVAASGTIDDDGVLEGELEDPRVSCQGTMRHIEHADEHLEDDEWDDRAQWSDRTRAWYRWWTGADGAPPRPPD